MKQWRVTMLSPPYDVEITFVENLGDKSNKFDVIQQIKRQGLAGEILNIQEVTK